MRQHHRDFQPCQSTPVVPGATTPRTPCGRFTGPGSVALDTALDAPDFTAADAAESLLAEQIDRTVTRLLRSGGDSGDDTPPVVAVKASPGAGKSRATRERLAQIVGVGDDIAWHAPTLALLEEAGAHAQLLGAEAHVFRGRSATDPFSDEAMCAKAELAERVARLGLPVQPTLCRRKEKDGTERLCPHFHACPYQRQREGMPAEGGLQRYMTTSYLTLPDPAGRDVALRVVDETFWAGQMRIASFPLDAFTAPRTFYRQPHKEPGKSIALENHADLLAAAGEVARLLTEGRSLADLTYSVAELEAFAKQELAALPPEAGIRPDQAANLQTAAIDQAEQRHRTVRRFRRLWLTLADARRQGRARSERVSVVTDAQGARHIRLFGKGDLPGDAPMLLLDADADPVILEAFAPGVEIERLGLRPNAHVIQLEDRRMSNHALLSQRGIRDRWCNIIQREVLFDRHGQEGGVLVGATRKVVKTFFTDAGHDFAGMSEADISRFMLDTPLRGAHWTWFGGRSLGSNRYRDCSCVVIIGREELPVEALEDQARALFGDTPGANLSFVPPDSQGRKLLPEAVVPYLMADGSARGARVRVHPDPRIWALQRQSRECATRQLVERLRLAHAAYPKRVIIGCNIPIAELPIDRLVAWDALVPSRMEAACAEAFLVKGAIRLSAPGLHADAPGAFPTPEAAKSFLKRTQVSPAPRPTALWPTILQLRIRCAEKGAREVDILVVADTPAAARATATRAFGSLAR